MSFLYRRWYELCDTNNDDDCRSNRLLSGGVTVDGCFISYTDGIPWVRKILCLHNFLVPPDYN